MINKLKPKSEFSRNVLTLMTGTTIALAIPLAISPILTRLYTPEDFGIFALYMAIVAILSNIANGKYELALMIPKKDSDAINLLVLGTIITFIFFIILIFLSFFFNNYFTHVFDNEKIGVWLYFVPITVLLMSNFEMLKSFNNRKKFYKDIATATVLKSIITAIIQLGGAFIKQGPSGLIFGLIISQVFANTKLLKNILNDKALILNISKKRIIVLARKYKKFPIFFMPTYGLNVLSSSLIPIFLGTYFSVEIAGSYFLVNRAINSPLGIISSSISSVFFQKVSLGGDCKVIYLKISLFLFLIGLIPTILIYIYGAQIFVFIFGDKWLIAGEMASILIIMFYLSFVTIPVSQLSTIKQKALYNIVWQLALFIGILVSVVIGVLLSSWQLFLTMYVIIQCALYLYGFFYEFKLCKS